MYNTHRKYKKVYVAEKEPPPIVFMGGLYVVCANCYYVWRVYKGFVLNIISLIMLLSLQK